MKRLIICALAVILISCEARLDNDKRGFFKTTILNSNGEPLQNAQISLTTFKSFDVLFSSRRVSKLSQPDEDFLLGQGITDANGKVSFLTLYDTNSRFYVNIVTGNNITRVVEVDQTSFDEDLTLEIPEIVLKDFAEVQLEFNNESGTEEPVQVRLNYFAPYCTEFYMNGIFTIDDDCAFFDEINEIINTEDNEEQISFGALYPSILSVDLIDSAGNESTQEFTINSSEESYEINY